MMNDIRRIPQNAKNRLEAIPANTQALLQFCLTFIHFWDTLDITFAFDHEPNSHPQSSVTITRIA